MWPSPHCDVIYNVVKQVAPCKTLRGLSDRRRVFASLLITIGGLCSAQVFAVSISLSGEAHTQECVKCAGEFGQTYQRQGVQTAALDGFERG